VKVAGRQYILSKEVVIDLLKKANEERYKPWVQAEMNKVNHSDWFGYVVDLMHRKLLKENGFGHCLEDALDELYSCRLRFREDTEMNEFFKTLIHVQMDLTADGPLKPGDEAVDVNLHTLSGEPFKFSKYLEEAKAEDKPVVVFAGSWT